jgi:hypothetical protein
VTFTVTVAARANPRVKALADIGRPRKDQPPCCDEPDKAPIDQKLVDRINALRPQRR